MSNATCSGKSVLATLWQCSAYILLGILIPLTLLEVSTQPGWAIDEQTPLDEPESELDIEEPPASEAVAPNSRNPSNSLDLSPALIEASPVLRRWLKQTPNIAEDIRQDPSFRTRLRLGYSQFPSTNQAGGWNIGVEDIFLGRTRLTLSADFQAAFNGDRTSWGTDLKYYILPLGSIVNVAPQVGYRHLETTRYTINGVNLGVKLLLVPSRTGAASLSLSQTWVAPGDEAEVGITTLSVGYALTHNLRLSTDIQKQNSSFRKDSRVGISLEWMF
jgi:hypothetical protein